jgi:hypothetical protein
LQFYFSLIKEENMPLQIKMTQADMRGDCEVPLSKAYAELQDWLENDAPGAPIGNPETVATNSAISDDVFLASVLVSY